ncbi:MAG: DJ-1 family glyoxalase III [Treponemataceae bacterium]
MKKIALFLADGFEEVEAITPIDYLRRAGFDVTTVGIERKGITGCHNILINCDTTIDHIPQDFWGSFDAFVIPGGMPGAANLAKCQNLNALLKTAHANKKLICAICAAPVVVLLPLGILQAKKFTCYPAMKEKINNFCADTSLHGIQLNDRVVVCENIITSQGAGCAEEFSLAIIEALSGKEQAKFIGQSILSNKF